MTSLQVDVPASVSAAASLEDQLAASLCQTASDVAHVEVFDDEQRSEVYAILSTLQAGTSAHRDLLRLLSQRLARGPTNA